MRFGKSNDDLFERVTGEEKGESIISKIMSDDTPKILKVLAIVFAIAVVIFGIFLSGFVVTARIEGAASLFKVSYWEYFKNALFTKDGIVSTGIVLLLLFLVGFMITRKNHDLNQVKSVDDRGVSFSEKGVYGTAEWLDKKEAKKIYEVGPIDEVTGVILGQYTEEGKECICLPKDTKSNRNILVLGSPGTGKSFCYVRNAIFQAIIRGESVVITDPKGELFESSSEKLRECGYRVWVYNLVNPRRSDAWNCLSEIYDPETGNISDVRVTEFCDTVMKNTGDGPSGDFWGTGESNLLKAIVTFCAWRKETALIALYENEGMQLLNEAEDDFAPEDYATLERILTSDSLSATMREREKVMRLLLKHKYKDAKEAEDRLNEIIVQAPPCDTSSMYHMIVTNDIKQFEEKFKEVPISHPAGIAWSIFKNGSDNVRPGIVQGLAQRLQLFQMRDIRRITTNDDICFEKLGEQKTALFCIISDKSTAMRALTSLFFTFLFKDVADAADRFGPENRIYVNVICDEFANLGSIPSFDVTISTVRSRKINISVILQSVRQLEKNYMEASETIISCCDTILFLGCNDTETAEFISGLSGVASIRVSSTSDKRSSSIGNGRRPMWEGYGISEGEGKRNLMNPDEVRRLSREEVIIYHNGCNILRAHRCGFIYHRFVKEGLPPPVRLRDYPLASEKYSLKENLDAFLQGDVTNLASRNQQIVNDERIEKENLLSTEPEKLQLKPMKDDDAFGF